MDSVEEADVHQILRQQEEITASHHAFSELSLQLTQLTELLDQLQINPPAPQVSRHTFVDL